MIHGVFVLRAVPQLSLGLVATGTAFAANKRGRCDRIGGRDAEGRIAQELGCKTY
jgi:hypothetical protein